MDALKKAEETRRKTGEGKPGAAAQPQGGEKLPELPLELEALDAEFMAEATKPKKAKPAPVPPQAEAMAAAGNLFAAKRPPPAEGRRILIIAVAALLSAAAIGGYFWWQFQSVSRPASPPPPAAAPAVPPSPATSYAPQDLPRPVAATPPVPRPVPKPPEIFPAAPPQAPVSAETAPSLRITTSKLRVDPNVDRGYELLNGGRLAEARQEYAQALRKDPKSIDALLGTAAIHAAEGRADEAEAFYLRALEADPKNPLAQAALLGLRGSADPVQSESRLKTLLAAQPRQPFLHFSLGNLYARQQRWHDAQQAFFDAHSGDPENADYLFNLAVSLDQLRQIRLAVEYYNRALEASDRGGHAGFDKAAVAARLRELQP